MKLFSFSNIKNISVQKIYILKIIFLTNLSKGKGCLFFLLFFFYNYNIVIICRPEVSNPVPLPQLCVT